MKSKKSSASRLAFLGAWLQTAQWHAGEPGPQRPIARLIVDELERLIEELGDDIVDQFAIPAERRRAVARAERAASRAASKISWPWQQRVRRAEYLADRREAARDRASAIARVWRAL